MKARYDKEFKEQAIQLSDEVGLKKAAQQLGVNYGTLADWRKSKNRNKGEKSNTAAEAKSVDELKKEIAELKKANDILKDALGFFALDRKK